MIVHDCQPYDSDYWRLHRGKPGCSALHRILTPKKWEFAAGAETLCCELIAQDYDHDYGVVESYQSAAMKNGHLMEPESRRYLEMKREYELKRVGLVESDCRRWVYSPDGMVVGQNGAAELKNPTPAVHIKWLLAGVVPPEHLAQCHGAILVAKLDWIDWMSYCHMLPPLLIRVYPDEKTVALAEALETFSRMLEGMREKIAAAGGPVMPKIENVEPAYF